MATVICVDGLGGHPETTFDTLRLRLSECGHSVIIIDSSSVVTHEDRVELVLDAYYQYVSETTPVILVGQSAGGSAVRIAAERLHVCRRPVGGVVMFSPAMPFGISYMTPTLWSVMQMRKSDLLFGRKIRTTTHEYRVLVEPGIDIKIERAVLNRTPISGHEARTLATIPPVLHGHNYRTLHVFGGEDRWIRPLAQLKLANKMALAGQDVETLAIPGAGHLTLASKQAPWILSNIARWIGKR